MEIPEEHRKEYQIDCTQLEATVMVMDLDSDLVARYVDGMRKKLAREGEPAWCAERAVYELLTLERSEALKELLG